MKELKKIKVNENCISCGACTAICDEVFTFNDEMVAEAIPENNNFEKMNDSLKDKVLEALEGCPASAIEIVEVNDCDCDECHCEGCSCE